MLREIPCVHSQHAELGHSPDVHGRGNGPDVVTLFQSRLAHGDRAVPEEMAA
jgi:hypothetical protein